MGTPSSPRPGRPIFAHLYSALAPLSDLGGVSELRRELLSGLSGRVVEVGCGTGVNFRHYPRAVTTLVAVEPEPALRRAAARAARRVDLKVEVVDATAETLPIDDRSQDAVVASLVLCSVSEPATALAELLRVLRPGGELRFLEHVRGGRIGGAIQDLLDPAWALLAGGCHLNRPTADNLAEAGFALTAVRRVPGRTFGVRTPAPAVLIGRALRPEA